MVRFKSSASSINTVMKAEIVTIGTELVIGLIVDTNAAWLARRLTSLGFRITRIVTVRDDLDEIVSALREALGRADLVITTGGLGPTEDDMTSMAVARAFNLEVVLNEEAKKMVAEAYEKLWREGRVSSPKLTQARLKMAMLPRGATPIRNRVGSAPGILLKVNGKHVICLPGVPEEMKAMFEDLTNMLKSLVGRKASLSMRLTTTGTDESTLAGIISELSREHPEAYIKSHARHGGGVDISITVHAGSLDECEILLRRIIKSLETRLKDLGVRIVNKSTLSSR